MKFKFLFLKHFQNNYFSKLVLDDLVPILNEINQENKYKQFPELRTCILFTEISEQMIVEKNHLTFYNELELLMQQFEYIPYFYLLDSFYKDAHAFKHPKVIHVNYMLLLTYWMFILGNNIRNNEWTHNTNLGLFLTGKSTRFNRGPLLFYFWKNNLIKNLIWSFYDVDEQLINLKKLLPDNVTDEEFQHFLKDCIRIIDIEYRKNVLIKNKEYSSNAYPIDTKLYEKTSYSIISETHYHTVTVVENQEYPMLSEKTYKAIINCHPFILAGNYGSLDKLESLGFKTFKEYLDYPNYIQRDLNERAMSIGKNIETFGHNCIKYEKEIRKDVIYNKNLLESICSKEVNTLLNSLKTDISILDSCIDAHRLRLTGM